MKQLEKLFHKNYAQLLKITEQMDSQVQEHIKLMIPMLIKESSQAGE
jgi:hypothetical protein